LDAIFPPGVDRKVEVDAPLDVVIVQVSKDIINDMPASDPRWTETQSSSKFYKYLFDANINWNESRPEFWDFELFTSAAAASGQAANTRALCQLPEIGQFVEQGKLFKRIFN
jgi:hypothetical protein